MTVAAGVLTVFLALAFLGIGLAKIRMVPQMVEAALHLDISQDRYRLIGVLEVAAAVGLGLWFVVPGFGVAAAVGLLLVMIGAVGFHLRAGDRPQHFVPAIVVLVLVALDLVLVAIS